MLIDAAVRTVLAVPSQDLVENNRAFHPLLASGIPVEITENGERRTVGLRLLDRANPRANRLLVANQFIVQSEREAVVALDAHGLDRRGAHPWLGGEQRVEATHALDVLCSVRPALPYSLIRTA